MCVYMYIYIHTYIYIYVDIHANPIQNVKARLLHRCRTLASTTSNSTAGGKVQEPGEKSCLRLRVCVESLVFKLCKA